MSVPEGEPGKRRYGKWGGTPDGFPEVITHCIEQIRPTGQWIARQCGRKRGYGTRGEFCKQHAKKHASGK